MGCGGSSGASDPGAEKIDWNKAEEDDEFKHEAAKKKPMKFDKNGQKAVARGDIKEDRQFDLFEGADAGSGDQFMAVRPYEGAIIEPANHNDFSTSPPDVSYELEYVYGYRCEDSRMNAFFNKDGHITYFTAALGVILDQGKNTQKFFGGGQVDNQSKKVARDETGHTNDITAMGISNCRGLAATGQNGATPVAFVWDSTTGDMKARFKLDKGGREVSAIAISPDNSMVALIDNHNDHNAYVFDVSSGKRLKKEKTGGSVIYHIAWSLKKGDNIFSIAGNKYYGEFDLDSGKLKKGLYGDYMDKATSHCCVAWDDEGTCYSGGANSHIYMWEGRTCKGTYDVHGKGFVCAIKWVDGKVISGAKDGQVVISDPKTGTAEKTIDVGDLVRAVDMNNGKLLAGLRNGTILEISSSGAKKEVMKSHSSGEAWGLAVADDDTFVTSGDDNKAFTWSISSRKWTQEVELCDDDAHPKAGGASSLTDFAPSKCARAVAVNTGGNGNVAIAHNDGRVTIRNSADHLSNVTKTLKDSAEWIECMAYSPDGSRLAVGSHDNNIYVYDVDNGYNKIGKLDKHNSFITSVDWSEDGKYIRSVCGAHELLFFDTDSMEQDTSGASNTVETVWATSSAKYGWLVTGIFPAGTDGTHINHVDFSSDNNNIVTGDDYGLVNVWRNPACKGATPISLRGHSEHVVRTYFTKDCSRIISIGGYDKTIMQWKQK